MIWQALYAAHGVPGVVAWAFWGLLSVTLHELGHGWAAVRRGDPTPIATGHMTWNPVVHIGLMGVVAFAVIGIPWGAMPIDPSRLRRRDEAEVALAGPLMNLSLFLVSCVGWVVWDRVSGAAWVSVPLRENLGLFWTMGGMLNFVLAVFNLIPTPPLDGSRIVAAFVPSYRRFFFESEHGRWLGLGGLVICFFFAGRLIFPLAIEALDVTVTLIELAI